MTAPQGSYRYLLLMMLNIKDYKYFFMQKLTDCILIKVHYLSTCIILAQKLIYTTNLLDSIYHYLY